MRLGPRQRRNIRPLPDANVEQRHNRTSPPFPQLLCSPIVPFLLSLTRYSVELHSQIPNLRNHTLFQRLHILLIRSSTLQVRRKQHHHPTPLAHIQRHLYERRVRRWCNWKRRKEGHALRRRRVLEQRARRDVELQIRAGGEEGNGCGA